MQLKTTIGGLVLAALLTPAAFAQSQGDGQQGDRFTQMQQKMEKAREAQTPEERRKLMHEHMQMMHEQMQKMHGMMGQGMKGEGMKAGDMKGDDKAGMPMQDHMKQMPGHMRKMHERMDMMQKMMEQMLTQQRMMMEPAGNSEGE